MTNKILTEMAFDEVVAALPSIHLKAKLTVHNVMLHHRVKELEEQLRASGGPSIAPNIVKDQQVVQLQNQLTQLQQQLAESEKSASLTSDQLLRTRKEAEQEKKELLAVVAEATQEALDLKQQLSQRTQELQALQEQMAAFTASTDDAQIRVAERTRIVNWLRKVNEGETVRALYGKKMAKQIENSDYE